MSDLDKFNEYLYKVANSKVGIRIKIVNVDRIIRKLKNRRDGN